MDLMIWFLLGIDGGSSYLFLLVKGFAFSYSLDVEVLRLVKDLLLLSVRKLNTVWVKLGKYCVTCSLGTALWRFLVTSVNVHDSSGDVVSYTCGLCQQTIGNKVVGNCVGSFLIIGDL